MKSLFTCDTFLFCRSRYGGVRRETLLHGVSAFRSLFCFSISKKYNRRVCVNYGFFLLNAAFGQLFESHGFDFRFFLGLHRKETFAGRQGVILVNSDW